MFMFIKCTIYLRVEMIIKACDLMYNWPKSVGCGACNGQRATRQLLYYPLSYMFVHIHIGWMVCMKSLGECRFCSSNHRSFRVRACVRVRVRLSPQRFLYRIYATFFYDYINNNGNAMVAQLLFASALKLAAAARIKKKGFAFTWCALVTAFGIIINIRRWRREK